MESTAALVDARDVRRVFDGGRVEALRGVTFAIAQGEFVAIQGPSGSGKSTLLQLIGALDQPTGGDFRFLGTPYASLGDLSAFRSRRIGFIFQSFHLIPTLTAIENVQIPMFEMPWRPAERRRRAADLLTLVGLADRRDHRPPELSGGERQRVAIARSLANEPLLLLADEPTGNLDSVNADRIMQLLGHLHDERGCTVIVITHDGAVARHAGRAIQMFDGRIASDTMTTSTSAG